MTRPASTAAIPPNGPDWLAHRYDAPSDAIHWVQADRQARSDATFLTDEYLRGATAPQAIARRDSLIAAGGSARIHFIFHAAYCCSTLLARVFDRPGQATTLKEPVILNDLVGWRHRGGEPARIGEVLDSALTLLARPFEPGEAVIVKPSNVVNGLAPAILAMRAEARAVLLYAPLRVYLTSIARKGMWGRVWVRDLLVKQMADGMIDLGFEPADYLKLTDLQVAAVGWLAQIALFGQLAARFPDRVRTLNSETLLARPADAIAALATLYRLPVDADAVAAMATGREFARNAKTGARYTDADRVREQREGAALHADEIDKIIVWAEAVATNAGVPLDLPSSLIA